MGVIKKFIQVYLTVTFALLNLMMICFMVFTINLWAHGMVIRPDCIYVPYANNKSYFRGTEEEFIAHYKNPYPDEKVYLEFEYLGKEPGEWKENEARWSLLNSGEDVNENERIITVNGGGLKRVYYFLPMRVNKGLTEEEKRVEEERIKDNIRTIRVVLGKEDKSDDTEMVYYYKIKLPETGSYHYEKEWAYAPLLEYDILIDNKEIPAWCLVDRNQMGEVILQRYKKNYREIFSSDKEEGDYVYVRQY